MSLHNLYQEEILDHYQNPRNTGLFSPFDFISPVYNPSCGDAVTICGLIKDDRVFKIGFEGKGCILSLAMASKLTEYVQHKKLDEILGYQENLVEELLNMQLGLKRMQCGLLPLQALQKGINSYNNKGL